jgi:RNA polymerase sigma-70 factor (ECF subfamily)
VRVGVACSRATAPEAPWSPGEKGHEPLNTACGWGVLGAVLAVSVARERSTHTAPITVGVGTALSFDGFYMANERRLFRALYVLTGSRDEAEDLAQHAFCRVWERWDRVSALDDPAGYLFRTAFNAHHSATRRAVRAARRVVDVVVHSAPTPAPGPADLAADRDHVTRSLARLSPRQREAVVLTQLLDCDASHAARIMRIRPATVRVLVSQARAVLARPARPDAGPGA